MTALVWLLAAVAALTVAGVLGVHALGRALAQRLAQRASWKSTL